MRQGQTRKRGTAFGRPVLSSSRGRKHRWGAVDPPQVQLAMLGVRGSRGRGDFLKKGRRQGRAGGEDWGQDGQAMGERRCQRRMLAHLRCGCCPPRPPAPVTAPPCPGPLDSAQGSAGPAASSPPASAANSLRPKGRWMSWASCASCDWTGGHLGSRHFLWEKNGPLGLQELSTLHPGQNLHLEFSWGVARVKRDTPELSVLFVFCFHFSKYPSSGRGEGGERVDGWF